MSAPSCLAFFGLRFSVSEAEIESLEARDHPVMRSARDVGLKTYWGNFGEPEERYFLFVGSLIGQLGPENSLEVRLESPDVGKVMESTKEKLKSAGLKGEAALHLQWMPDV